MISPYCMPICLVFNIPLTNMNYILDHTSLPTQNCCNYLPAFSLCSLIFFFSTTYQQNFTTILPSTWGVIGSIWKKSQLNGLLDSNLMPLGLQSRSCHARLLSAEDFKSSPQSSCFCRIQKNPKRGWHQPERKSSDARAFLTRKNSSLACSSISCSTVPSLPSTRKTMVCCIITFFMFLNALFSDVFSRLTVPPGMPFMCPGWCSEWYLRSGGSTHTPGHSRAGSSS